MELIYWIRRMSIENITWGAPKTASELALLGHKVADSTVAKYMVKVKMPDPSQRWGTFIRNHLDVTAACDFFVVPTATFKLLCVFVEFSHARRQILHINFTEQPTATWTARQIVEAFPGNGGVRDGCTRTWVSFATTGARTCDRRKAPQRDRSHEH